jgi:hypothetical protein
MNAPVIAEITLRIRVEFDQDTWGPGALDEVASDLSLRLFCGNDDHADEAATVTCIETLDRMVITPIGISATRQE